MTRRSPPRRQLLAGSLAGLGLAALPALAAAAPERKPRVVIHTDKGDIVVELEARRAPLTSANFLRYVEAGKYDGASFFRATHARGAPGEGAIVAAPAPRIHPFPPIAHESTATTGLRHGTGTLSLGRFAPGTGTSNIFICLGPTPAFDAHPGGRRDPGGDTEGFAAFGQVVSGLAVARRIHAQPADGPSPYPTQKGEWLNPPVMIKSMRRM